MTGVRRLLERHRAELAVRLGLIPRPTPVEGEEEVSQVSDRLYHFASRSQLYLRLMEFDAALEREREGTYGVCLDCGEPIPATRLKAIPEAARDAKCQAKFEQQQVERVKREAWTPEDVC